MTSAPGCTRLAVDTEENENVVTDAVAIYSAFRLRATVAGGVSNGAARILSRNMYILTIAEGPTRLQRMRALRKAG